MGNTLQDQLLKAGVINKQKAQEAKSELRKKQRQKNKGSASSVDEDKELSRRVAQEKKLARDRELNRQKQEKAQRKAIAAQIDQLIKLNRVSCEEGDTAYNFVDGKTVRTIYVTEEVFSQLGRGWLSIARFEGRYEVIPGKVAEKINQRDSSVIIASNQSDSGSEKADDPYADYQVPDDLIW